MKPIFSGLLVAGGLAGAVLAIAPVGGPSDGLPVARAAAPIPSVAGQQVPSLAPMLARVTPGVVNIAVRGRVREQNPLLQDPFFRRFFDLPQNARPRMRETEATGSGIIVDAARGYVLTNGHVVENATKIEVTTKDNRRFTAKLLGRDPETDIALLQIPSDNLTAVPLGDSDRLQVGDFVLAIGNPFGLGQTVTSGIVSALGRSGLGIEGYEDFIQTDASINPGNSGGPLVNLNGECVGINTAILAPGGGNIGIGFAVPIDMARRVMDQLVRYGEVKRGRIGVAIQDLTPDLARSMSTSHTTGAVIARVEPDSPAARAGLRTGDLVVSANGTPVRSGTQLRNVIGLSGIGSAVDLRIDRKGSEYSVAVNVEAAGNTAARQGARQRQ
ncbi:MAG: Do family serine endopeptidase [Alphaproteobacteria bacterium]